MNHRPTPPTARLAIFLAAACVSCSALSSFAQVGQAPRAPAGAATGQLPPLDPQRVEDQDDMTWSDYHPIPGVDWADLARQPTERTIKVALIAADFPDQDFVMTMKKNSDPFNNPQIDPIKREEVPKFYADFWSSRSEMHHGHTVSEYWMEQSHGKIGVSFTPFGPYKMPKKSFQYGLSGFGQQNSAPADSPVSGDLVRDCDALWTADAGNVRSDYQLVLRMYAGYDETCVWQEFGEMKFQDRDSISPEFGNPDPTMPRWAPTRYTPWTSWKAAQWLWSNSSIIQGECSGSIVHEVSHAAFRIGDNNNNPYVTPYRRVGAGPWDIMDRGSFNGPGGPHDRWQIPVVKGGAMPAGIMLRNKINFKFVGPSNVLTLSRDGLAKSGLAVAKVIARSADPGPTGLSGIVVRFDGPEIPISPEAQASAGGGRGGGGGGGRGARGAGRGAAATQVADTTEAAAADQVAGGGAATTTAPGTAPGRGRGRGLGIFSTTTHDHTPWEDPATHPFSQGIPDFTNYTLEVVERIGYDSFCPDSGVLLAKNKDQASSNGGPNSYAVFNWVIDAHPEDINKVDFKRPNGEPVMRTIADYRQLNDALFHAGLNSGSQSEWEDTPNRLHFYVIDMQKDASGILSYTLGVRSLDGSGPQQHGMNLSSDAPVSVRATNTPCTFTLTNTGKPAATDAALHPQDANAYLDSDIYRLNVSVQGDGWTAQLQNALAAVKFGEMQKVPVYVSRGGGGTSATVTLTATSESDPTKTMTATCKVSAP